MSEEALSRSPAIVDLAAETWKANIVVPPAQPATAQPASRDSSRPEAQAKAPLQQQLIFRPLGKSASPAASDSAQPPAAEEVCTLEQFGCLPV
jgi:hypothetical protein